MKIQRRILRGEPIQVGDRALIPEARLTCVLQRQATFGAHDNSGYGWAMVRLEPTAMIEHGPGRTRRLPIRDQTWSLLLGLLGGALALPFLMELAVRLARPKRPTASAG